jgi:hypothetical protein
LRGSGFEIAVPVAFLKPGAFLVHNVATYPVVRAIRRLGVLRKEQFDLVGEGLLRWLGY